MNDPSVAISRRKPLANAMIAEITMTATAIASKAVMDSSILGVRSEKVGEIDKPFNWGDRQAIH